VELLFTPPAYFVDMQCPGASVTGVSLDYPTFLALDRIKRDDCHDDSTHAARRALRHKPVVLGACRHAGGATLVSHQGVGLRGPEPLSPRPQGRWDAAMGFVQPAGLTSSDEIHRGRCRRSQQCAPLLPTVRTSPSRSRPPVRLWTCPTYVLLALPTISVKAGQRGPVTCANAPAIDLSGLCGGLSTCCLSCCAQL